MIIIYLFEFLTFDIEVYLSFKNPKIHIFFLFDCFFQ